MIIFRVRFLAVMPHECVSYVDIVDILERRDYVVLEMRIGRVHGMRTIFGIFDILPCYLVMRIHIT